VTSTSGVDPAARAGYAESWALVQEQFVDTPGPAAVEAHALVITVMHERGYPTEDPEQIAADLSVEHAATLDHYRIASAAAQVASSGAASTEELRQAMLHYRALFQDLLGTADAAAPPGNRGVTASADGPISAGYRPVRADGGRDGQVPERAGLPVTEADDDVRVLTVDRGSAPQAPAAGDQPVPETGFAGESAQGTAVPPSRRL
jgi:hypothetical protein